jgi:hypothetical protein
MSTFCFHLANIEILIIYVDEICGMLGLDTCDDELNPGLLHVASVGGGGVNKIPHHLQFIRTG